MLISLKKQYSHGASWVLVIYLSFMVSGCSFRPAEISPEEARILQTRVFSGSPEEVAKAVTTVLQDIHYTLGSVDMGLGIITATRTSEKLLAPISRETEVEGDVADEMGTFCLIAGGIAVVGLLLAFIFGGSDDDEENEGHDRGEQRQGRWRHNHHDSSSIYVGSDGSGPDSYTYTMTINMEEVSLQQTSLRVTVQGQHFEGMGVVESGPVQSQDFYSDFFNRLQSALNG
ncbi:MAG: hypothetical protein HQ507_08370 [Candidatus Marinimicrobia bacterium]|nr:hypothetical protein [Candidatus Neomarinimicrobiota bacterium]